MTKVSVILPFYNSENTIQRALNSIQQQTYPDFECILVDNNSTDHSSHITKSCVKQDSRFRIIKEKRQGVVFASNAAELQAKGQYICRMDADDWMFPDRLQKQVQFLDKNAAYGAISGLVEYVSHQKKTEGFKRYVEWVNSVQSYQDILLQRFVESPVVNPSAMWRRSISMRYGMYKDGDFPEDYELWLRWLAKGIKISKLGQPLIKWYDSDNRLTRTDSRYSENAFYNIKTKYLAQWLSDNNPHHPQVVIWGASRLSRKRAKILEKHDIEISGYIDISTKRDLDRQVILFTDIKTDDKIFVLVYIAQIDARDEIKSFLENKGFREGENYIFVS